TVLLVSHDRALLREVCDEFWLVADGVVKPFDGDLDDYQRWLLDQSRAASREQSRSDKAKKQRGAEAPPPVAASKASAGKATPAASPAPTPRSGTGPARALAGASAGVPQSRDDRKSGAAVRQQRADEARPLRKELNLVDNRLGVLFAERDAIEAGFGDATLTPAALAESGRRLKQIAEQIEELEARWLDLSTRIDQVAESAG
ncbi:MAG: ABC transporter, partial [Burkholderiaceae bacterium]